MTENPHDLDAHSLTGAYALDALDDVERARVEAHLRDCADCAAEVRSFVETAARLGAAEAVAPPPSMRAAVLAEVSRTRQLPPPSTGVHAPRPSRATRWLAVAAAALVVVAGGLGGVAWQAQQDADRSAQVTAAVSTVLNDPDHEVVEADFMGGRAMVATSGDQVVFLAEGSQEPPSDDVYVLWMLDAAGTPRSAGALVASGDGGFVGHTTGYHAGEALAVTVEPDADVDAPTGDVVMSTA